MVNKFIHIRILCDAGGPSLQIMTVVHSWLFLVVEVHPITYLLTKKSIRSSWQQRVGRPLTYVSTINTVVGKEKCQVEKLQEHYCVDK